ncbi:MAG: hypothetical protein KTR32_17640, partial [Granulosicoccus sp.]|nr:hypothetical protein [Granulosicoccus sp.]
MKPVSITGARLHNLKNIDVSLPTDKLVVVTGVSGSGKSTLVFDLLFEEGRKRYLQAIGVLSDLGEDRRYEQLTGLRPTVAIKQGVIRQSNPRSVVGSKTRILHYLGMLFAYNYNRNTGVEESLQAAHFSFNSPLGMCEHCRGRGYVFAFNFAVLLPDEKTTLPQMYCNAKMESSFRKFTARLIDRFDLDLNTPFLQLPQVVQDIVLYGRDPEGAQLSGLDVNLQSRLSRGKDIGNAMSAHTCEVCGGSRLGAHARGIDLAGKSFGELASCTIAELNEFLQSLAFEPPAPAANSVVVPATLLAKTRELVSQLVSVKLDYLSLYRPIPTLSGGELQRLFLMSYLDSELESLLYIFDEPTAGLHEIEKKELLQRIISLKAQGNAVIVVEHDKTVISLAEHIVDIGPGAGENGGTVVYQGDYAGLLDSQASATGRYLAQAAASVAVADNSQPKSNFRSTDQQITLIDVRTNNLQSVSVSFPLGKLVGVAGVSGSGKSSLISGTLVPALRSEAE